MSIAEYVIDAVEKGQPIIQQWGLLAVAFSMFCETLFCAGIFFPGFCILAAAGFLAAKGSLNPWAAFAVALLGGILGAQIAFQLGRLTGDRFLKRRSKVVQRLRAALEREGNSVLLWYHHVSPMRAVMPYLAGSMGFGWARWLTWDAIGLALWVMFAFGLGYLAYGPLQHFGDAGFYSVLVIVALMIAFTVWRVTRIFRTDPQSILEGSL
jgi:membrane-associated protein